jgi:uncharacterized membrane protein YccF (DUF307 family)
MSAGGAPTPAGYGPPSRERSSARPVLNLLLNVLWLVAAGFWLAVAYAVAGLVLCLLIVTIPFGIAAFRMANFTLWPFGRTLVRRPGAGLGSAFGNLLWLLLAGWWLALAHLVTGAVLCLTVIGIPLGLANFKLVPVALLPLGREIVATEDRWGFAPASPGRLQDRPA